MDRKRAALALTAILALASWLRLDGIGFGLDLSRAENTLFTNDVDARGMAREILGLLERGDMDPGEFLFRGPAAFCFWGVLDAVVVGLQAPFHPDGWSGVVADLRRNPSLLHFVHRWTSALAGVLSVALLFRIVQREFGRVEALLASLILAVAYVHVRDSHFATVDVLSGFMTLAAIDQMLLLIRDPRRPRYLASGLLAGVATATKYFGGILGMHLVLAHLLARSKARESGRAEPGHARLGLGVLACPAGFFLVSPTAPFFVSNWMQHVLSNVRDLHPSTEAVSPGGLASFHARYTLACGLGEPAFLLALGGLFLLGRLRHAGRFLVGASLLLTSALFATRLHAVRFGIPLVVTLAIPAGLVLARAWRALPGSLAALLTGLVLAPSLARSLAFDRVLGRDDTRVEMLAVLRQRGQPAEDVLAVGLPLDLPVPEPSPSPPFHLYFRRSGGGDLDELLARPPRTILLSRTTLRHEIPDLPELERLLSTTYREVLRLDVGEDPAGIFLPHGGAKALRVAYASPWRQTRPGPAMVLYERLEPAGPSSSPGNPPDSSESDGRHAPK